MVSFATKGPASVEEAKGEGCQDCEARSPRKRNPFWSHVVLHLESPRKREEDNALDPGSEPTNDAIPGELRDFHNLPRILVSYLIRA